MSESEHEAPYRITLEGGERLEDLPVREVAAFLDELVGLVARGAGEILRRPIRSPGRYEGPIEDASRIRLASLTSGSIVAEFLPAVAPDTSGGIGLDAENLSDQAFGLLIDVAAGSDEQHPELASALTSFIDRFAGRREGSRLRIEDRRPGQEREVVLEPSPSIAVDQGIPTQLGDTTSTTEVTGRFFEANLEARSAQVRTPSGDRVAVIFGPEHDEDIQRLFGDRAALRGDVRYDPMTNRIKSVRIREIMTGDQLDLELGGTDFWIDRPASELVAEAGVQAVTDPAELELSGISDEEWAALHEALSGAR